MNVPKNWLQQFINLDGITDQDFADQMTFAGDKVEAIHQVDNQTVFEFEITSNRPDTLSIIGIAREVSAVLKRDIDLPAPPTITTPDKNCLKISIESDHLMPAYSAILIDNVTIKPSSQHIQQLLKLAGINPVNNIVDITNYLMHQTGQPMHAFDADTLKGNLTVRTAKSGEIITPLDHKQRTLEGSEIIIEDEEKLIDLAGLMGGLNSEISNSTTKIYLLVPIYDPISIRRASKSTKIRTDASTRFEKQIDLHQTPNTLLHAVKLISQESGGQPASQIDSPTVTTNSPTITLNPLQATKLIGNSINKTEIDIILSSLNISKIGENQYQPPTYRRDLQITVDLIEEIARIKGYNNLPKNLPSGNIPIHKDATKPNWPRLIADTVTKLGYTETYASTLIGLKQIKLLGLNPDDHLKVLHPMSKDYEYMRINLLETLLPFLNDNLSHTNTVNLFELGRVFYQNNDPNNLPEQPLELGLITTTHSYPQIKGQIEHISNQFNLDLEITPVENHQPYLHPTNQTQITQNGKQVGLIGQLHPRLIDSQKIDAHVALLNITESFSQASIEKTYQLVPNQPPIIEDYTFPIPQKTLIGPVIDTIKKTSKLIESVSLKDVYHPQSSYEESDTSNNQKSNIQDLTSNYTFTITYRHPNRPLTDTEIAPIRAQIVANLENYHQAKLIGELL